MEAAYILCIEASTEVCSVALSLNGGIHSVIEHKDNQHVKNLVPYIEQLLNEANIKLKDLKAVAVSEGPGSYTSLRTGLATAKGLCAILEIPLILVPTLTGLASYAKLLFPGYDYYLPLLDARREDAYIGVYDGQGNTVVESCFLQLAADKPEWLSILGQNFLITGNASSKWNRHYPLMPAMEFPMDCSAKHLCGPAFEAFEQKSFSNLASAVPNYINVIKITKSKK